MRLKNKKTGEIRELPDGFFCGNNLKKICEEWEDVPEEPKEDGLDNIIALVEAYSDKDSEIYPKETVEKLKAWKRLRDEGFRIDNWYYRNWAVSGMAIGINASFDASKMDILNYDHKKDLTICFGEML